MYLVFGAGGFLGSYVIKHILSDTNENVVAVSRTGQAAFSDNVRVRVTECDVRDRSAVRRVCSSVRGEPLKVIYLCAQHNIDVAAREPHAAHSLNVTALDGVLCELENVQCLFFSSSDTVYGEGGTHRFLESDPLNPVSVYGRQKAEGESLVLSRGYNVLRLPFMFGKSLSPHKKHFCDMACERLLAGEPLVMYTDSVRSTLSFDCVAAVTVALCEGSGSSAVPPVLNVAGDDALSKYDVGLRLADALTVSRSLIAPGLSSGTYAAGARRAVSTIMDNTLLKSTLGLRELTFDGFL